MFDLINIRLKYSFCPCPDNERDWKWGFNQSRTGTGVRLTCAKCHTILEIPHNLLRASFEISNPNPVSRSQTEPKPNVVPLRLVQSNHDKTEEKTS